MKPYCGLTIDLGAIACNWRFLRSQLSPEVCCAAVIKSNAYGLGAIQTAWRLVSEGCECFFVANLEEALELHPILPDHVSLYVLSGCRPGEEEQFLSHGFAPVIVSLAMFNRWRDICRRGRHLSPTCALKIDTGMNRLGLSLEELAPLLKASAQLAEVGTHLVMSHLACADEPEHAQNALQLERFQQVGKTVKRLLPDCQLSLANSAGLFLGQDYHFDIVRPGIAIYGGQPQTVRRQLLPVVHLALGVVQTRALGVGESVGYGATQTFATPRELIVVGGGYADGLLRSLGNKLQCSFNGYPLHQIGRISMDSIVLDATGLPESLRPREGDVVEIIGETQTIDDLAEKAGTISYEILTSLGNRYPRRFLQSQANEIVDVES